jgi:mono/diheme cytochrome c family protein
MRLAIATLSVLIGFTGASCGALESDPDKPPVLSRNAVANAATPPPPGTMPRGRSAYLAALAPPGPPVDQRLLRRGAERYAIHCAVCHGVQGLGDGPVARYGYPRPPSFTEPRISSLETARIVGIIHSGIGRMYGFGERLDPGDHWAIAHHVKALQARASGIDAPGAKPMPAVPDRVAQ